MTPNFFKTDAFNAVALTAGINRIPNNYGKVRALGIFNEQGVTVRDIWIEEMNGVLNLLPTVAPGGPATLGTVGKRKGRPFRIPHIPHDDVVLPEEVQGVRAFGSENVLEGVAMKVAEKLATMRAKHAITLEYHRVRTLAGEMLDADGSSIYNWFTEFGFTETEVDFNLDDTNQAVISKCLAVKREIEKNLKGEVMSGIHCFCSPEFYDQLTTHVSVEKAFQYFQSRQSLEGDYRSAFTFGGITFEEYIGEATDAAGNVRKFIDADKARFFPLGTQSTFRTLFAPADFNEAVNTMGLPVYAKLDARKFDRGWDLHTQSNPLSICMRPELLIKAKRQ